MTKQRFIIKDWAGNVLNYEARFVLPQLAAAMEFDSFEDAWAWLYDKFDEEECFDDYFVVEA